MSGGGSFMLVLPGGGVTLWALDLLQVQGVVLSVSDPVTTFTRMLEAAALFSGTSSNLNR